MRGLSSAGAAPGRSLAPRTAWLGQGRTAPCCPPPHARRLPSARPVPQAEPHHAAGGTGLEARTEAEDEANKKRWQESGGGQGSADQWRWSLNWDEIEPRILVGACPRSPSDVDTLAAEAGATAIVCLQSDLCLEALEIDLDAIRLARARAVQQGVVHARVAVRDFDHADQALMLPEAVRALATLLALGHSVYVHCTAGINRATLTVVGYYTFVKGWGLDDALAHVRTARPQAHPYVDCWRTVRARLLEGRGEEVAAIARELYTARQAAGGGRGANDAAGDWEKAEASLIQRTFERQVGCTLSLVEGARAADAAAAGAEAGSAASALAAATERARRVGIELDVARSEIAALVGAGAGVGGGGGGKAGSVNVLGELDAARTEVAALRAAIQDVVTSTGGLLEDEDDE